MAAVDIIDVHKAYGGTAALHGVSVEVPDGAFTVLVGPSGCGKSTLLRMIAGLEEITAGVIRIDGRAINEVEPKLRDIAMVFQNYALYPHMTVAENMGFSLRVGGSPKAEIARRVGEAAAILGLSDYLGRYPRELSGGQRQRVAMGRAIVRNPKVFLFDEPLSNLDAQLRVQMRAELKDLHARLRTTTIYVTHDQVEAMTMADRIVVMRAGRIEQVGAPLDLYDRPANTFVAQFIGSPSMNLLPARIDGGADGARLVLDGGAVLPLAARRVPQVAGPVLLGLRPEHLRLGTGPGSLAVHVLAVEATGADTTLTARLGDARITALLRERAAVRAGEAVSLMPDMASARLFDAATGHRID